tara:strand:+ start:21154 stop:21981 length:828 start_codon:yes stop_codon:yes gene_type:complete
MKTLKNILTKDILEYEYANCKDISKISEKLKISKDSIRKYIKLYNIKYYKYQPKIYSCNNNIFYKENENAFYLAGFIAADGCVRNRVRKKCISKSLIIALSNKDHEHLEKIKMALQSNNPIKSIIIKPNKKVKVYSHQSRIEIYSAQIVNDLLKFNITPNKTYTYNMPDWLINHELVNHFIRGYFDGDGSIGKYKKPPSKILHSQLNMLGTELFIKQYKTIIEQNCNVNDNKIIKINNIYSLSYSGNNVVKRIYEFLYKDATIYLDRKKDKFKQH